MQHGEQQVLDVEPRVAALDRLAHRLLEHLARVGDTVGLLGRPRPAVASAGARAAAHRLAGDAALVERLPDRAAVVEQQPEQQVVGLDLGGAEPRRLRLRARDRLARAPRDHEALLRALGAARVARVRGLLGHAQRLGDLPPRPAGLDRLVDVRGLERVEAPAQLAHGRQARRRIAEPRGGAGQLLLARAQAHARRTLPDPECRQVTLTSRCHSLP